MNLKYKSGTKPINVESSSLITLKDHKKDLTTIQPAHKSEKKQIETNQPSNFRYDK